MSSCPNTSLVHARGGQCCLLATSHRPSHRSRRYPSDMSEAQWAIIEPLLPTPGWLAGRGGRRTKHCRREIVDAILYVVDNGIKWRALPADFPPWSTVYNHFAAWESAGTKPALLDALRDRARLSQGRRAGPSAGSIDSASVKAAETVSAESRGFDAGKKINGRKRHIAVDTLGLLICVLVTGAEAQDRVAARNLLARLRYLCPSIRLIWSDSGYTGTLIDWTKSMFGISIEITPP